MTPWPFLPNGRGRIHVPFLLLVFLGGILILAAAAGVVWLFLLAFQ